MSENEIAQAEKLRAETYKACMEAKKIEAELTRPWFKKAHLLQAITAGFVAVPLVWFYVKEIAIPFYEIENISLQRENEEIALNLQKKEKLFSLELSNLIEERDNQEKEYLRRLSSLEVRAEKMEHDRIKIENQYKTLLAEKEISDDREKYLLNELSQIESQKKEAEVELESLRNSIKSQSNVVENSSNAFSKELMRLSPIVVSKSDVYERSKAIVISLDDYSYMSNLPGVKEDSEIVSSVLRDQGFDVNILYNPNKYEIDAAFSNLTSASLSSDRVILYWAGHGFTKLQSGRTRGYFPAHDCIPNTLENCIPMEDIFDLIERSNALSAAAIIDTSHANFIFPNSRGLSFKSQNSGIEIVKSKEIISATDSNGLAFDSLDGGAGPIATSMLSGLKDWKADFNDDGVIRMRELYHYIVSDVSRRTNGRQVPTYFSLMPNGGEMAFFNDQYVRPASR